MKTINELVNDAIMLWVEVTGVNLGKNSYGSSEYNTRLYTEELNASRTLDMTGLTSFMMLRGLTEWYLKEIAFTAYELILEPAESEKKLATMRALRNILEDPQVLELVEDFQTQILDAALYYRKPPEQVKALSDFLETKYGLAFVRRDALRSMERLEAHQFVQGNADTESLKFNPDIYEFWNINSLLRAVRAQRMPGITLALIRDPEQALFSYFVFAIRNGDTITVLTDRSKEAHPASKRMSRRPDRAFNERASRHWFPYSLVEVEVSEDQKRLHTAARTSLVPINVEAVPLKKIGALEPEEFIWATLMFDLIRDKYWKKDTKLPELSYTGEMVVEPHALVGEHGALVKEGLYKPLQLAPLTRADVTLENTAPQWQDQPTGQKRWMVDRYQDQVPDNYFNVVGEEAKANLLKAHEEKFLVKRDFFGRTGERPMEMLDPLNFGSKDRLEKDRLWAARVNQMKVIDKLAKAEFESTKGEIIAWYAEAVKKNAEALITASVHDEFLLPHWYHRDSGDPSFHNKPLVKTKNALRQIGDVTLKTLPSEKLGYSHEGDVRLGTLWNFRAGKAACFDRPDVGATIFTAITPNCPQALAILCNIEVKNLPFVLQWWYKDELYDGNHILNRLDPEDWVLENYWRALDFKVYVPLCKWAYNARRNALNLPRKVWEAEKED